MLKSIVIDNYRWIGLFITEKDQMSSIVKDSLEMKY